MRPGLLTKPQLLCVAYVVVHTLLHLTAGWFEVQPGIAVSIWYPPCGLALSLLVLAGPRYWWLVFLTNFATAWIANTSRPLWTGIFFPGLLTANYALAAWIVRRLVGTRLLPGNTRETLVFTGTIMGAPLFSAVLGTAVITFVGRGKVPTNFLEFLESVRDWWIGDASGLLTVVPAAIVFLAPWLEGTRALRTRADNGAFAYGWALLRGAVLIGTLVLILIVPVLREHRAFYLCFLPLIWICVAHGLRGATLASLSVMVIGLIGMHLAGTTAAYSYIFLLFVVAVAGVGLGLGTMVTRRDEAEARLAASNTELTRLRQLEFDEKVAAQLSEEKARLEVLRYQLNPHFLYNSLNSIYGLLFESAQAAGEMVLRLSDFCRATLTGPTDELPTLGAEIDALRSYLDVEKVRWGDKLQVEIAVAPEVGNVRLPPFLLLPLVENAIKYGSRTSPEVLGLRIDARLVADALVIEIANTGRWLIPDKTRPESTGIGLENLHQRLRRYYPDAHVFTMLERGGWVTARLELTREPRGSAAPMAPPTREAQAVPVQENSRT
ncbi:MAG: hypothetical protein C0518_12985 [Opitutus sp.]|nr:hypothetical protein [Opitutus sp.]